MKKMVVLLVISIILTSGCLGGQQTVSTPESEFAVSYLEDLPSGETYDIHSNSSIGNMYISNNLERFSFSDIRATSVENINESHTRVNFEAIREGSRFSDEEVESEVSSYVVVREENDEYKIWRFGEGTFEINNIQNR
jgi:hypothetical protein